MEMGVDCSVVGTLKAFESLAPGFLGFHCSIYLDCYYHPIAVITIPISLVALIVVLISPVVVLVVVPPITIALLLISPIALGSPLLLVGRIAPLALIIVHVL